MYRILAKIWKNLSGNLQWYSLWFFHDKFMIGVCGIILNEKNEVLLLQHRFWKEGSWGLPSGYAEKNEKLENTLSRELKEETNLEVEVNKLVNIKSGFKLRLEICFWGKIKGGKLKIDSNEILAAQFFPINQLPVGLLDTHRELINELKI